MSETAGNLFFGRFLSRFVSAILVVLLAVSPATASFSLRAQNLSESSPSTVHSVEAELQSGLEESDLIISVGEKLKDPQLSVVLKQIENIRETIIIPPREETAIVLPHFRKYLDGTDNTGVVVLIRNKSGTVVAYAAANRVGNDLVWHLNEWYAPHISEQMELEVLKQFEAYLSRYKGSRYIFADPTRYYRNRTIPLGRLRGLKLVNPNGVYISPVAQMPRLAPGLSTSFFESLALLIEDRLDPGNRPFQKPYGLTGVQLRVGDKTVPVEILLNVFGAPMMVLNSDMIFMEGVPDFKRQIVPLIGPEIIPSVIWVPKLPSYEISERSQAGHTHATIAALDQLDLKDALVIDAGAGGAIPDVVALKRQGASFAILIENNPQAIEAAERAMVANGLIERADYAVINADLRDPAAIEEAVRKLNRPEKRIVLISNIGDQPLYGEVNNQTGMALIPHLERATGAKVAGFVGAGYGIKKNADRVPILRDQQQIAQQYGFQVLQIGRIGLQYGSEWTESWAAVHSGAEEVEIITKLLGAIESRGLNSLSYEQADDAVRPVLISA